MPRKEKKLIKWVIERLNSGKFEWHNQENRQFWLPWPRQNCKAWNEEESEFIEDYIKMQGRFQDGVKKDYVKWKASLRTALNKENSIKLVKYEHTLTAKLYQLVDIPKGCKIVWKKEEVYNIPVIPVCDSDGILSGMNVSMDEDSGCYSDNVSNDQAEIISSLGVEPFDFSSLLIGVEFGESSPVDH